MGASGALLGGPRGQANPQRRPELEGRSGAGEGLQAGWQPPEGIGGAQKEWWVQVGDDGGINIVSGSMHEGSAHGELLWKAIE